MAGGREPMQASAVPAQYRAADILVQSADGGGRGGPAPRGGGLQVGELFQLHLPLLQDWDGGERLLPPRQGSLHPDEGKEPAHCCSVLFLYPERNI